MGIYLDNSATTKVRDDVAEAVLRFLREEFANPSSKHAVGKKVRKDLEESRKKIANFLGAKSSEIIFTSGGTESNNLAIRGLARKHPSKKHIITSAIEHPSVLETCRDLEKDGYLVDYIKPDSEGIIDPKKIREKIRDNTLLVSVMHVNNEIGTIQPVEEIAKICREFKIFFHCDMVQSFNKIKINLSDLKVDLASFSGHKICAPKGIGALYVRSGTGICPIITGGGQESGIRSGTENVPGIIGLAKAIEKAPKKEAIEKAQKKLFNEILKIPRTKINGSIKKRIFNNVNVSFYGIEAEALLERLSNDGIYVSTGSACSSTKLSESHVLKAIGLDEMYIHGSIRISIGEELSEKDIKFVIDRIKHHVGDLRKISPFKINLEEENEDH
ncbi:cysteine desulfurase [Candidatus Pacearchaeota archaeon]|nr:MAG: cysteine desulfurase [Candidatus Pacearchaeota archaeon]